MDQLVKDEIINHLRELSKQPIFHMSLADKELFHSNFLAWLGGTDYTREYFLLVLEGLAGKRFSWHNDFLNNHVDYRVAREYNHFDLCILKRTTKSKELPLVVLENKNKSIPTITQLKGYKAKVDELYKNVKKNEEITFILLTLITDFVDKGKLEKEDVWKVASYADLFDSLSKVSGFNWSCTNGMSLSYISETDLLVEDYKRYVRRLSAFAESISKIQEYNIDKDIKSVLKDVRLESVYYKLLYSHYATCLAKKLKGHIVESNFAKNAGRKEFRVGTVFIDTGFTQKGGGAGILDVAVKIDDNFVLKIQVQGNHYRHAIEWVGDKVEKKDRRIYTEADKEKLANWINKLSCISKNRNLDFFRPLKQFEPCSVDFGDSKIFKDDTIYPTKEKKGNSSDEDQDKELAGFNKFGPTFKYQSRLIKDDESLNNNEVIENIICEINKIFKFDEIHTHAHRGAASVSGSVI